MRPVLYAALWLAVLVLVATGWMDSDWQMVTYRYSEWHRTQETWEYCPYLKVNWWIAWQIDLARIVVGSLLAGYLINDYAWTSKMRKKECLPLNSENLKRNT